MSETSEPASDYMLTMSEEARGFDDATEFLLTPTHGPPADVTEYFHPPAETPGCGGCSGAADHATVVGCPRCDYVRGFNDGLCK